MKQAKHNQQVQVTRSSKVKEQVNRQGDARFVLGCSFLFRESMSMLERCGTTKCHQIYKGLTFFSSEPTTKVNPLLHWEVLVEVATKPSQKVGAHYTSQSEAPVTISKLIETPSKPRDSHFTRVYAMKIYVYKSSFKESRGNSNYFGKMVNYAPLDF
jgi:hypothetical protein